MKSNIKSIYRKNNGNRVLQGDILNNILIPIFDNNKLNFVESYYSVVLGSV